MVHNICYNAHILVNKGGRQALICEIQKKAAALAKKFNTTNAVVMAKKLGINVKFMDIGTLKGLYTIIKRNRYIILNPALTPKMKNIVCAHELGHDQLHRALAKDRCLQEFLLYDMDSRPEYEANIFAANLLLKNEDILEYINTYHYNISQIAQATGSDVNLIAIKITYLRKQGYSFTPQESNTDFLKY